jgi:enediyne polyketide synthase
VTGIACRLSGASDVESFWNNLAGGRDPFSILPSARFDSEIFATELPGGKGRTVSGALVEDFGLDWRALRLPPAQVNHLHRVERLALAVMGDALTDAGLRPRTGPIDRGCIWLAAGTIGPDPWLDPVARIRRLEFVAPLREALETIIPGQAAEMGTLIERVSDLAAPPLEPDVLMISACIIAGRASHIYDFRGGHLAIDAGMCSSLAAVSQAVRTLQTGECDVALVCAAAPLVTPSNVLAFAHRGDLAVDSPRPFAPDATGTLLGDGTVAVVLERADDVGRKRVYAVVEGVGSSAAPTFTDSGALAQCVTEAAERALAQAGVCADSIEQVESRAAGIVASDRAEAEGLAAAYCRTNREQPILLTSCVPTVGFLQAASGLVSFAKAALAIHRRCWPGQPAVSVAFEPVPGLCMPSTATNWTGPRRAAVSDAGPSSLAYHAILADPRDAKASARPARRVIQREPIAIVGAGVIAPGAADLETFWSNTLARLELMRDLPRSRWDVDRLIGSSAELARAFRTRLASTVELPVLDPLRHRVAAAIADGLDPGTVLAIGVAEQALIDAGHKPGSWPADRVQVIFGQISMRASEAATEKQVQYALLVALASEVMREAGIGEGVIRAISAEARARFDQENRRFSDDTLSAFSSLSCASRTAAAFGFSGELLSVDAACASSLVAVKIASDALQSGEADVVLAGGVSFHLLPEYYVALGLLDALSTRAGRPFHRDADGFVPAEAAGAVVLKRLSDARQAKDRVYAVISGHGVSSDGHGLSIYSPNSAGQQLAMARALAAAGLHGTEIDLIEAHGPGAPLGDRTEMVSLAAAYGERPFLPPLSIASAKSLIGHSSSAGAMISLVRAALALGSKVFPPSGGNGDLAPDLPFGPTLELSRVTRPWTTTVGRPRRAAVNSFGMTGINHHVLLEEADPEPCRQDIPIAAIEHPATRPGRPLSADRFILVETPVSLPNRQPIYPLQGRTFAIIPDRGPLCTEMEHAFAGRGARLIRLELPPDCATEADVRGSLPPDIDSLDGVLDLSAFGTGDDWKTLSSDTLWSRLKTHSDRSFAILRILYERFTSPRNIPGCYVVVTSVRAGQNAHPSAAGNPLGAFFQGLARSLKQELPSVLCKAIDIDSLTPLAQTAAAIVREIEDGNDRVDVRYRSRRFVTTLCRANFPDAAPVLRTLRTGDVFIFSGGARGVVYQCATALARRGINVVVTGRRPMPDPTLPWVTMTCSEFSDFRRAELVRRRGSEGPAHIIKTLDQLELQRQAHANIAKAQAAGLPLHYELCDITDPASVTHLVQRIRSKFGRIDGVGHGAMIEQSGIIPRKTTQTIDATLSTKVLGLANLLTATHEDSLKVIVAFGSGVGRYGNSGQTDYAAANALVAALLQAYAQSDSRHTHCVTIDWPAWESLGATANPDIAGLLRTAGVTCITPEEGSYWFLSELMLGDSPEVVICSESMLQSWPFLARDADGKGERTIEVDDDGRILLPSRWPMIDRVVKTTPDSMTAERCLSLGRDLYLPQHLLNGLAVLPATFGCEMLAEGALLACPGYHVQRIDDFHVDAPLSLPRGRPNTAHVIAHLVGGTASQRVVRCELRSSLGIALEQTSNDRLHHGARLTLQPSPPASLGILDLPQSSDVLHATSFYAFLRDPVQLGQLFASAHWIQLFDDEAIGLIEPPDLGSTFSDISEPCLVSCPLVIDAALQVAGSWDGYRNGFVSVPVGIDSILLGRRPAPNERTRAHCRVLRIEHPSVFYDISIVGDSSELLVALRNVRLRRLGTPLNSQ